MCMSLLCFQNTCPSVHVYFMGYIQDFVFHPSYTYSLSQTTTTCFPGLCAVVREFTLCIGEDGEKKETHCLPP